MADAETGKSGHEDGRAAVEILDGSDSGSDTRAGSLRGGSVSGSDDDPDSRRINEALAEKGRLMAAANKTGPSE